MIIKDEILIPSYELRNIEYDKYDPEKYKDLFISPEAAEEIRNWLLDSLDQRGVF